MGRGRDVGRRNGERCREGERVRRKMERREQGEMEKEKKRVRMRVVRGSGGERENKGGRRERVNTLEHKPAEKPHN